MSQIFDPLTINRMQIKNRFVRSATMDNMGSGGLVTEAQIEIYRQLAKGEIGLIISSGIFPSTLLMPNSGTNEPFRAMSFLPRSM